MQSASAKWQRGGAAALGIAKETFFLELPIFLHMRMRLC